MRDRVTTISLRDFINMKRSLSENIHKIDHRPAVIVLKRWLEQRNSKQFYLAQISDLFEHSDRVVDRLVRAGHLHCLTPDAPESARWYEFPISKSDEQTA